MTGRSISNSYRRQVSGEIDNYSIEKRLTRRDGGLVWMAV